MTAETDTATVSDVPRTRLAPYEQDDPEAQQIAREIDALPLPPYVAEIRLTLGEEWLGNPGVFLYVLVQDEAFADLKRLYEVAAPIERPLNEMLFDKANGRYPFISLRTVGEQRELDAEDAKPTRRKRR